MTIELAMWFALGFLVAGAVALLVMGALWRRAVRLTTARIAATKPADYDEAVAARDLLAATHAREVRRFELALGELRHRDAEGRIEAGRLRATILATEDQRDAEATARRAGEAREAGLAETIAERDRSLEAAATAAAAAAARIGELEAQVGELQASLMAVMAEHEETTARVADEHAVTVAALGRDLETARVDAATRRTAGEALQAQIETMRRDLATAAARLEAEVAAHGLTATTAEQERDRADRLDRRIERLVGDVAAREEIADRRQRELERAREALTVANSRIAAIGAMEGAPTPGDNVLRTIAQLEARNRELEGKLEAAHRPNGAAASGGDAAGEQRRALRRDLADMAAEMVRLTAAVEGKGSPIDRIVAAPEAAGGVKPSLADRIRHLRGSEARSPGR